jgi:hypothetical protein
MPVRPRVSGQRLQTLVVLGVGLERVRGSRRPHQIAHPRGEQAPARADVDDHITARHERIDDAQREVLSASAAPAQPIGPQRRVALQPRDHPADDIHRRLSPYARLRAITRKLREKRIVRGESAARTWFASRTAELPLAPPQ